MAEKVGELYLELVARNGKLLSSLQQTERAAQGFTGRLGSTFKQLGSTMVGSIVGGLTAFSMLQKAVDAVKSGIERAMKLEALTTAFENLAGGAANAAAMVEKMDAAFRGTVDSVTMLQQANTAMILGVATTAEEFEFLAMAARRLGKAVGIDTAKAMESLTVGIGRQSKLWLDNLGIIVDTEQAYQNYATELGKAVTELTDAEKKQAFLNATMSATRTALGKLGADIETAGEKWQAFKATWTDVFTGIGSGIKAIGEGFYDFVVDATQGIQSLFTGTTAYEIKKIQEDTLRMEQQRIENEQELAELLAERRREEQRIKKQIEEQLELSKKIHQEEIDRWQDQEKTRQRLHLDVLRMTGQERKAEEEAAKARAEEMEKAAVSVEQQLQVHEWLRTKMADIDKRYKEKALQEEKKLADERKRLEEKGLREMEWFRAEEARVEREQQRQEKNHQDWLKRNAQLTIDWMKEIGQTRVADRIALEQWRNAEIAAAEGGIERLMLIDKLYKARLKNLQETRKEMHKPAWMGAEQLWKRAVVITKAAEPAVKRPAIDVKLDPSKVDMDTLMEISKQTTLQEQIRDAVKGQAVTE